MSNFSSPLFDNSFDGYFLPLSMAQSAPANAHQGSSSRPTLKKSTRLWTYRENEVLLEIVPQHDAKNWTSIARQLAERTEMPEKSAAQVSQHWRRTLCSNPKKWSHEEDALLLIAHYQYGNKWSVICRSLEGRTDTQVKFRWEAIKKKHHIESVY